jgi:hypothetical protein
MLGHSVKLARKPIASAAIKFGIMSFIGSSLDERRLLAYALTTGKPPRGTETSAGL